MHTTNYNPRKQNSLFHWEPEFTRLFFRMVVPIALQNLIAASLHIIDGIMVSGLGEQAYAGVTQANRVTFLFNLFLFGTVSGAAIFFAQFWGKGDIPSMRRVQGLAMRIAVGIAAIFMLLVAVFHRQVLGFFLKPGVSFEQGLQYLVIIAPAYLIMAVDNVYAAMLKSSEHPRIPMMAAIVAIGTNTILNYGLIYGKLGLPMLGVRGAAIATVISTVVSLAINVGMTYLAKLPPAARLSDWAMPERVFLGRFFRTITPVVLNEGLWALGTVMYSVVYGAMGDAVVAAMGIVNISDQLTFAFGFGIVSGAAVIVGRSIGADREDEAFLYAKRIALAAVGTMAVMGIVLMIVRRPLADVFRFSTEARDMSVQVMGIAACFLWVRVFNGVNVVGILRAGGDTMYSMVLDVGALWIVGVPAAVLTGIVLKLPLWAVFLSIQGEECLKVIIGLPRFLSRKWIHNLAHDAA